ncbi:MAG TPA: D-2-hydroxyacid dehydrogenase [Polyangia bacterium]|nr:D-2-hydroxyacid dehydrogenase [Polyangia bacterium]
MTSPRIVVLDSFTIDQGEPETAWRELSALGDLVVHPQTEPAEIGSRAAGALAVISNKVPLGAEELAALPTLRYVGVSATGTNVVDLTAARTAGIAVSNVPGYATESVAELVFALILHFSHDVAGHNAAVKVGVWSASSDFCFFRQPLMELAGKTLVVVGSGAIGGAVARIAEAFGMRVVRAAVPGAPARAGQTRTPLPEALPLADFVSLHCPLTEATQGLVGAEFLDAMKPGAILINTGRGGLVDEAALAGALSSGHLGGAGLDVLSTEPPPPNHPLTDPRAPWTGRVVVTPHIGWGTVEARRRLVTEVARNLEAFLRGESRNRIV